MAVEKAILTGAAAGGSSDEARERLLAEGRLGGGKPQIAWLIRLSRNGFRRKVR
jgi:hypothetical protein